MSKHYFLNCFILVLPIVLWNMLLTDHLPEDYQPDVFSKDIPSFLIYGEQVSRVIIFLLAFLMPLDVRSKIQKFGLYIYIMGLLLYFASWMPLIYFPNSGWSNSALGFSAPAITPAGWLTGICLMGNSYYFNLPFRRWLFILVSAVFLSFHISHTLWVYDLVYLS